MVHTLRSGKKVDNQVSATQSYSAQLYTSINFFQFHSIQIWWVWKRQVSWSSAQAYSSIFK